MIGTTTLILTKRVLKIMSFDYYSHLTKEELIERLRIAELENKRLKKSCKEIIDFINNKIFIENITKVNDDETKNNSNSTK